MFRIRLFTFALFASGTVVWGAPRLVPAIPVVPVSFELNRGQADPAVRYLARSNGAMAFLVDDGAVLASRSEASLRTARSSPWPTNTRVRTPASR